MNIIEIAEGDILKFDDELYVVYKMETATIHLELYQLVPEKRMLKVVEESWIYSGKKDRR